MDNERPPARDIPPERKTLFYFGMILNVGGVALCLGSMLFLFAGMGTSGIHDGPPKAMFTAFLGGIIAAAGRGLMRVGRRGAAGSGLVLDPKQARRDLEPWNRAAGGMASDALEEVGPLRDLADGLRRAGPAAEPAVKVRCRACRALADESARFCPQCGQPM